MVGHFHMLERVGHDHPKPLVEVLGRGVAHRQHLVALFYDELELSHPETLWDRGLRGGLELG